MNISKKELKEVVLTAIDVFQEVQKERGVVFSSEDIVKLAISLYIQISKNGNGPSDIYRKPDGGNGKDKDTKAVLIGFGKYKGKTVLEVVKTDRGYVAWLADKSKDEAIKSESKRLLAESPVVGRKFTIPQPKLTH
ncbi:MAG: hypothetical protein LHV68_05165 [Elusimicrobia bacterium]|nr:hypothetical protein [Candidatus Liberimonas magnetica]